MSFILDKDKIIKQKEIEDAFASVAKSMQPLIDNIKQAAIEGKKLSDSFGGVDKLKEIINLSSKVADNEKKLLELNAQTLKIRDSINKQKLSEQSKKEAQAKRELAAEEKKEIANKRLLIAAQQSEKGSKQQLQAVNAILTNRMKQLNVLIPEQAKKYEQLNAAINRNKQRISEMDKPHKSFLSSIGSMLKGLVGLAAAYLTFQTAIRLVKNVFNLTKEFDSLSFSMKTVISDQNELAQTQLYLTDISIKYGAELVSISQRYIKFRAAAIQANLSAKETQDIFSSMTKISGVLGLKTDELAGIYLALEQMLSKGKVTTEELRRQLGERLPGAFGIMADTLGVSLRELDKMLKSGQVLSAEVLPKFAKEAEKAFGVESVERINTLAAAQSRLTTSWQLFVKNIRATEFFTGAIDLLTDKIAGLQLAFGSENVLELFTLRNNKAGKAVRSLISELDELSFEQFKDFFEGATTIGDGAFNKGILESKRILEGLKVSVEDVNDIFLQYYQKRELENKLFNEGQKKLQKLDVEGEKKSIDEKKKAYENLVKFKDDATKEEYKEREGLTEETIKLAIKERLRFVEENEIKAKELLDISDKNVEAIKASGRSLTRSEQKDRE
ncbi:MAG: tape measure protein, partial [Candidatus Paceibacterota bacterium]